MAEMMNERDFSQLATLARVLLRSESRFHAYVQDLGPVSPALRVALKELEVLFHPLVTAKDRMETFRQEVSRLTAAGAKPERVEAARALAWALELDNQRSRRTA